MTKTIRIWGKRSGKVEQIDETTTLPEARRLVHEYAIAFGPGWSIWYGKKDGN